MTSRTFIIEDIIKFFSITLFRVTYENDHFSNIHFYFCLVFFSISPVVHEFYNLSNRCITLITYVRIAAVVKLSLLFCHTLFKIPNSSLLFPISKMTGTVRWGGGRRYPGSWSTYPPLHQRSEIIFKMGRFLLRLTNFHPFNWDLFSPCGNFNHEISNYNFRKGTFFTRLPTEDRCRGAVTESILSTALDWWSLKIKRLHKNYCFKF